MASSGVRERHFSFPFFFFVIIYFLCAFLLFLREPQTEESQSGYRQGNRSPDKSMRGADIMIMQLFCSFSIP